MSDLRIIDRDGCVMTQGAMNHMMAQMDAKDETISTLKRQVEVLVKRIIRAWPKKGSHRGEPECYGCLSNSDCADEKECMAQLIEWSLEQARKGGG